MTCAQLFENRFCRTPDAALTPVTVPDLDPASPKMWPIKVAPPFILHSVFWERYPFMAKVRRLLHDAVVSLRAVFDPLLAGWSFIFVHGQTPE